MKTGSWLYRQLRRRIPALAFLAGANILGAYLGVVFATAMQSVIDNAVSGSVDGLVRSCGILVGIGRGNREDRFGTHHGAARKDLHCRDPQKRSIGAGRLETDRVREGNATFAGQTEKRVRNWRPLTIL